MLIGCNAAPIVFSGLLGNRAAWPVDAGRLAPDGYRWLGATKTWRGLLSSGLAGAGLAALLSLPTGFGVGFAALTMLGDLISSFIKRRLGLESSARVTFLDQLPESVAPLLYAWAEGLVSLLVGVQVVVLFFLFDTLVSPLLFRLGIRRHPH